MRKMTGNVPVIEAEKVTLKFGCLTMLRDLHFHAQAGEILAVIGPNRAARPP